MNQLQEQLYPIQNGSKMKSVKIEKPCHEDWSAMTPSQKGAFCDKCQIDVFDFSERSNEEVKSILLANKGNHLCGRFTKSQLADLNRDYHIWENQSPRIFQSKFLLACMLTFGMSLFTSCIEDEKVVGQMEVDYQEQVDQAQPPIGPSNEAPTHKKGKIKCTPDQTDTSTTEIEEFHLLGEIQMVEKDSNLLPMEKEPEPPLPTEDSLKHWELFEMGDIDISQDYYEHLEDSRADTTTKTPEQDQIVAINGHLSSSQCIITKELAISVYPNPSSTLAAILLSVPNAERFELDLYDLSGSYLNTIFSGWIEKGSRRFEIDLAPYEAGMFVVRVRSNTETKTVKVQKVL